MASPLVPVIAILGAFAGILLVAFVLGMMAFLAVAGGEVRTGAAARWYDPRSRPTLERALRADERGRPWATAGALVALAGAFAFAFAGQWWLMAAAAGGIAVVLWWAANHGLATGVDKAGGLP